MNRINLVLFLLSCISIFGCQEKTEEEENNPFAPKVTFEIKVLDATRRTPSNPTAVDAANATVSIFLTKEAVANNKPTYTGKTNAAGVYSTTVPAKSAFYLTAEKGNAKHTKNGFRISGIYESQEHIQNLPSGQVPVPKVGDLIYDDVNGDGIIDDSDKLNYYTREATTGTTTIRQTIYIAE